MSADKAIKLILELAHAETELTKAVNSSARGTKRLQQRCGAARTALFEALVGSPATSREREGLLVD